MFAHAAPTLPGPTTPASPTEHTRPSRLRGLSYLRQYAHSHSHNNSNNNGVPNSPSSPTGGALTRFVSGPVTAPGSSPAPTPARPSETSRSYFGGLQGAEDRSGDMARRPRGGTHGAQTTTHDGRRLPSAALTPLDTTMSAPPAAVVNGPAAAGEASGLAGLPPDQMPTIRFLPYQDPRSNKPSLAFSVTSRTLPHEDCVIRVGRYSERDLNANPPPNVPSSAPVGFKSKVVSRRHCEFWCSQGQWYIKDVKSSSGTFLNHIRLSQPSVESRPFPVNDGDVVQLGIDFRGGEEQIFRCVKIRVECNRAWQKGLNSFNMSTHKRLRALGAARAEADNNSNHSTECSICLMSIAPCQSLFVAPCSHVWHFRCIRPILSDPKNYPQFLCPNCRAVADLEADIDDPAGAWHEDAGDSSGSDVDRNDATHTAEDQELARAIAASLRPTNTGGSNDVRSSSEAGTRPGTRVGAVAVNVAPLGAAPTQANETQVPLTRLFEPPVAERAPVVRGRDHILLPEPRPSPSLSLEIGAALPLSTGPIPAETHEGPLTPRNDAGPFVFDGSAGRESSDSMDTSST